MLAAPAQAASPPPAMVALLPSVTLPAELDRVLRDYEKAWQAKDPAALSILFAEDGFVLASGRPPVRGRDAIRAAYTGDGGPLALRAFAYGTQGSVGYIIGAFGPVAGGEDRGKFVLTLRREPGGRWLITADMDNSSQRSPRPSEPAPTATPTP
jgi:ketosteroid isomerase-like protein